MILGKKKRNSVKLIINTIEIEESRKVALLGITIDNFLISMSILIIYVVRQIINYMHYEE